jgi:16S rRNA (uracil1498-N3)-methyltransferase
MEQRPPRAAPVVFVGDLERPVLLDGDRHHLTRVLRLRPGAAVSIADGSGRWRSARLGDPVELVGEVVVEPKRPRTVVVGFSVLKGDRNDLVVQKLTELGVDEIVVLDAERSVVRWDGATVDRKLERLRSVAREACMQCRRATPPTISGPAELFDVVGSDGFALAEPGGDSIDAGVRGVLVGPEGGWTAAELESAARRVDLGPNVLRAETAAIAAAVLLTQRH